MRPGTLLRGTGSRSSGGGGGGGLTLPTTIPYSESNISTDRSALWLTGTASRQNNAGSEFWGLSVLRVDVADAAGVVDGSDPYLYAGRFRVSPRVTRTQTAVDDVVGVVITNKSYGDYGTTFSATEALYIGHDNNPSPTQQWNAAIGIDTVAQKAIAIDRGPYDYGILITASINSGGYAMRVPNNTKFGARNNAGNATLDMMYVDTSDVLRLGSGTVKAAVGAPAVAVATHLEVHGAGVADGATLAPHLRIVDTTAFAVGVGGEIALGGYQDATPNYRTFAAIKSGKENATSGNRAGYLALWTGDASSGLVERVRINSTGAVSIAAAPTGGGFLEFNEISEPTNGAANTGRLYITDNGSGKSQLCVRFATGATVVVATEP